MKVSNAPSPTVRRPSDWQNHLEKWVESPPAVTPDGDLVVSGLHHRVFRLDGDSGQLLWESEIGDRLFETPTVTEQGTVLVHSRTTKFVSDDDGSGLPDLTSVEHTIALDPQGREKWRIQNDEYSYPRLVGGRLLLVDQEHHPMAIDPDTGQTLWRWEKPVESVMNFWLKPGPDGGLYDVESLGGGASRLSCYDPATGEEKWSFVGGHLDHAFDFNENGTVSAISTKFDENYDVVARHLHLLDPETGKTLWKVDGSEPQQFQAHHLKGGMAVVSSESWDSPYQRLDFHDVNTGGKLWTLESPPVAYLYDGLNDDVLVQSFKFGDEGPVGQLLTSYDRATGERRWRFSPEQSFFKRMELVGEHLLAVASEPVEGTEKTRTSLMKLDPKTGQKLWEYDAGLLINGIHQGDQDCLFVAVGDCKAVCLDATTGEPRWHYHSDTHIQITDSGDGGLRLVDLKGKAVSLTADSQIATPGDIPNPGQEERNGGVITRMVGSFNLAESETVKVVNGREQRNFLFADFDYDGVYKEWDYVVVRDLDGNGELTDADLAELPTRAYLEGLDQNADGQVNSDELREAGLFLWRDSDGNGTVDSQNDFHFQAQDQYQDALVDLDPERFRVYQRYASPCPV